MNPSVWRRLHLTLTVGLAGLVACASGLVGLGILKVQFNSNTVPQPPPVWIPSPQPTLERAEDLEGTIQTLGYQHVHIYRWHDGLLEGWVQLHTDGEPAKKNSLDFKAMLGKNDPQAMRGTIIIAIKKPTTERPTVHECVVSYRVHVQQRKTNGLAVGGSFSGTIPGLDGGRGISREEWGESEAKSWYSSQGKTYELYQLKMSVEGQK
jgi:hypothetical protein